VYEEKDKQGDHADGDMPRHIAHIEGTKAARSCRNVGNLTGNAIGIWYCEVNFGLGSV
jgi:hypothetical protein